jgi:hypothetical protein
MKFYNKAVESVKNNYQDCHILPYVWRGDINEIIKDYQEALEDYIKVMEARLTHSSFFL